MSQDGSSSSFRASFKSNHRWPDSEAEFVRVLSYRDSSLCPSPSFHSRPSARRHAEVVDSYTCRQMFLRSYTFSRKETMPEKTKKCIEKAKGKVSRIVVKKRKTSVGPCLMSRFLNGYCSAMSKIFKSLLLCTTSVDVSDQVVPERRG